MTGLATNKGGMLKPCWRWGVLSQLSLSREGQPSWAGGPFCFPIASVFLLKVAEAQLSEGFRASLGVCRGTESRVVVTRGKEGGGGRHGHSSSSARLETGHDSEHTAGHTEGRLSRWTQGAWRRGWPSTPGFSPRRFRGAWWLQSMGSHESDTTG